MSRYGKRRKRYKLTLSIPEEVLSQCDDIENFSQFLTTCLERHIKAREREELRIMDIQSNKKIRNNLSLSQISQLYLDYTNYLVRRKDNLQTFYDFIQERIAIASYDWVNND